MTKKCCFLEGQNLLEFDEIMKDSPMHINDLNRLGIYWTYDINTPLEKGIYTRMIYNAIASLIDLTKEIIKLKITS